MDWVAIISILSSLAVALGSLWAPLRLENQKSIREEAKRKEELRRNELAEIDQASLELLEILAMFRGDTTRDVDVALTKSDFAANYSQAASVLQSRLYKWESKVWKELSASDRQAVKDLRKKIEDKKFVYTAQEENPYAPDIPEIVDQVLVITRRAAGRE